MKIYSETYEQPYNRSLRHIFSVHTDDGLTISLHDVELKPLDVLKRSGKQGMQDQQNEITQAREQFRLDLLGG